MSDQELRDELMTLLVAGHETTATVAGLGARAAGAPPGQAGPARRELRAGDDDYVDAVCKETLRLRPVLPIVVCAA